MSDEPDTQVLRDALANAADVLDMLCEGLAWNIDNHPTIMNCADDEALATGRQAVERARAVLTTTAP